MVFQQKQEKYLITAGAFFAFAVFGFMDNLKGPVLPVLLSNFNLSYTKGSTILLMLYLGFMFSILGSGFFAGKYGNVKVLLDAGIIMAVAAAGMSKAETQGVLYPLFLLIGIAMGSIEVGANGIITDIYPQKSGKYLNNLAVFHGAGSMAAPAVAGIVLGKNIPWQSLYKGSFFIILFFPVVFIVALWGSQKLTIHTDQIKDDDKGSLFQAHLILLAVLIFLYVASEIGFSSWLVDYLLKVRGFTLESGSLMLTLFWAFMMSGRFIASFIVEKAGYLKSLSIAAFLSLLVFSLGLLPVPFFAFLLPLTGLFFAMIFPTITALAAKFFPGIKHKVLSLLFFFAGLGGLVGPWVIGFTADRLGIAGAFPLLVFFISGIICILLILKFKFDLE